MPSSPVAVVPRTYSVEQLLEEENRLALPSLSESDAIAIGQLILSHATRDELPVTIEIRRGPRVVFRAALRGTRPDNDIWIAAKVRVVERFGHSSLYERIRFAASGTTFADATGLSPLDYAAAGGGFPLSVIGTGPVGSAIVSGLSQEEDHALIVECLQEYLAIARH